MTFIKHLFDNKDYITKSLAALIEDEIDRIVMAKVACADDVCSFVKYELSRNGAQGLAELHRNLKSFVLPGDVRKVAAEEFMDLSGLPKQMPKPEGEDFYDLTGVMEEIEKVRQGEEDDDIEPQEETLEDTEEVVIEDVVANNMIDELKKVAYSFGLEGKHVAAYEVEKTVRAIQRDLEDKKIKTEKK